MGLDKKSESFNHKGAQASRNSPMDYFSAVARPHAGFFTKVTKVYIIRF